VLWLAIGAHVSATTISAYDALPNTKAKATLLSGIIVDATRGLIKELQSPLHANGQKKTAEQAAKDRTRAALVPKAVAGQLATSDRIGLLAVRIAIVRRTNPATHLEPVVRTWILDQVDTFQASAKR
jgi:hypothetical protein